MRCRERGRPTLCELLENRPAECRAFQWIGSGSQLVDEGKRRRRRRCQDLREIPKMCTEGGKTRFDRLLVADVGEVVVEDREFRPATARRRNSRLSHRGEEAHCFEQDCFAARVWTRYDERALGRVELKIECHDFNTPREQ